MELQKVIDGLNAVLEGHSEEELATEQAGDSVSLGQHVEIALHHAREAQKIIVAATDAT